MKNKICISFISIIICFVLMFGLSLFEISIIDTIVVPILSCVILSIMVYMYGIKDMKN